MTRANRKALLCRFLPTLLLLSVSTGSAQTAGSISGFVRNASGTPAAGVAFTLSDQSDPSVMPVHALTDSSGAYHFDHVAFGSYHLQIDRPGEIVTPGGAIVLSDHSPALRLDLTVAPLSAKPAAGTAPALQLQAAGIRGYIDPGGYSAPASAAAATDLVRNAADLNRADKHSGDSTEAPCSLAPALLQAVATHPDDAGANRELGQYYLAQHQPEEALVSLRHAWALDRNDPATLSALAEALLQDRQFQAAHDLLTENAARPDTAAMHRLMARSEEGLGSFAQAAHDYQAAAALQPTEADFYGIGYELILAGSPGAASSAFEAGTVRYPGSTMLLMGLGTAAFLQGRSAEATRIFLKAAQRHPSDPRPYPFLSAGFSISGVEPDAVESAFRSFYDLSPDSAEAAYFYALSLLHRNQADANPQRIEALLERAVQLDPGLANPYAQLGSIYFEHSDYTHAADALSTAIRLDPSLWELRYKLSAAYKRVGDSQDAEQQMRLFLARREQNIAENHAPEIHIEQFLSVFNQTGATLMKQPVCGTRR